MLITRLLLIVEVCNVKPTCRISWAGNLPMCSVLTLGPSFKVKWWFTGFGELSFRWIQICIDCPMHRSSSAGFTVLHFYSIHLKEYIKSHIYIVRYCVFLPQLGGKLLWEGNSLHSEKQDGRRRHFFENYLHFSTGCFS